MKTSCPHDESSVKDSRPTLVSGFYTIRRRRVCKLCGRRFTTYELRDDHLVDVRAAMLAVAIDKQAVDRIKDGLVESIVRLVADSGALNFAEEAMPRRVPTERRIP